MGGEKLLAMVVMVVVVVVLLFSHSLVVEMRGENAEGLRKARHPPVLLPS